MVVKKIIYYILFVVFLNQVYSVDINVSWNKTINFNGDNDVGNSIVIDGDGNSYSTGYVYDGLNQNLYVISYDVNGGHRWNRSAQYPGELGEGKSIVVDGSGNSYVTGYVTSGGWENIYVISYDTNGNHRWNHSIYYTGGGYDIGNSIVVDGSGNSYITGIADNGMTDLYITSYDTNGNHRWNHSIDYMGDYDEGSSIVVDGSGNSYVTGYVTNVDFTTDLYISSYDTYGVERWTSILDTYTGYDEGISIAVDGSGNSYITGSVDNGLDSDLYIISYNGSGFNRWNVTIDLGYSDSGNSIVVDGSGNSYVVGMVNLNLGTYDMYITSYDINGNHRWNKTLNYNNGRDYGSSIVVDGSGNSYITGNIFNGIDRDLYATSYDTNGVNRWNKTIDYNGGFDFGNFLVIDGSGSSYIVGYGNNSINNDIYILKISENQSNNNSSNLNSIFPIYGISSLLVSLMLLFGFFIYN